MLAPASAPTAPPTHAPLWPFTECPIAAPMPPPTSAPRNGSPCADAVVESVPAASAVPSVATIKVFLSIAISSSQCPARRALCNGCNSDSGTYLSNGARGESVVICALCYKLDRNDLAGGREMLPLQSADEEVR